MLFSENKGKQTENKSSGTNSKNNIFVFSPEHIIKPKKTSKWDKFLSDISNFLNKAFENKNRVKIKKQGFQTQNPYLNSVKTLWNESKSRIISSAVAVFIFAGGCAAFNAFDFALGYEVILDGETIGQVTAEETVYDAIESVRQDVKNYTGDEEYSKSPVFVRRLVSEKNLSSKSDIKKYLLSSLDYMVGCYGIYIGDEPALALTSKEAADFVLDKHKKAYGGEQTSDSAVDFVEKVNVKESVLHIGLLKTPDEALKLLAGEQNSEEKEYTVKANDTLWDIAEEHGLTVERLLALNNGISENIKEGDKVKVEANVPLLSVRCTKNEEYTEEVPFEVEKINDANMYENTSVVTKTGVKGKNKVLAKVTKINGVETERTVISTEAISLPENQIEKVGTKKRPATTGSGTFINPTYGSLSSRYGSRWGRKHNGIDIAGSHGSSIKAADGGVVTYSGWMDGYGKYIVINHENGYQTAYGHCSALTKKVGDRVYKGEEIAKMGNTGRSTGTHLHFEVKKNGVYQNPLSYVGY